MEEKIKEIVSRFIKLNANQIHANTVIDRSAMASSILLHRMYASLASAGLAVENYWEIKTFGALMHKLDGQAQQPATNLIASPVYSYQPPNETHLAAIGIDIEQINLLPKAGDYREDHFYTSNFSSSEIAHCILQASPLASFAGLFAAKEAIVKADNKYLTTPFNNIVIEHLPNGKPSHAEFSISITHTNEIAAAVAVRLLPPKPPAGISPASPRNSMLYFIAISALILALCALLTVFFRS